MKILGLIVEAANIWSVTAMTGYRSIHTSALALPAVLLVALTGCTRSNSGSATVPVIKPPVITMPSPNAFDSFTAAGKSLTDARAIKEAASAQKDQQKVYTSAEKVFLVKENQPALEKLRKGLCCKYQQPFRYGIDARYPEYTQFRNLAYLLALESQVKMAQGDWLGAVSSCQDGLMLGELIRHGDGNGGMGSLVGIACQNIVRPYIWDAISHLTSAQAKSAVIKMQKIQDRHFPIQESMKSEKTAELLMFQDCFSGKCKDPLVKDWAKLPDSIKAKIFTDYSKYMDESIRCVQLPYASKPVLPEIKQSKNPAVAARNAPADMILALTCPNVQKFWFKDTYCLTKNRLLTVDLALHAYWMDHGSYPTSLSDLTPTYLGSIPSDLFALKDQLCYRRDGGKYILWSVGPDGCSDNGRPVDPKAQTTTVTKDKYGVSEECKGDIVAGIQR